jgi:hypothetical protein
MQDSAVGDSEYLGSPRCRVAHAANMRRRYKTAVMLGITVAIALGFPPHRPPTRYRNAFTGKLS